MAGTSTRRLGVTVATAMVIAGVVAASSMSASGVGNEAQDPYYEFFGTLTINLNDRSGSVVFAPVDGDPVVNEINTNPPCNAVQFALPLDDDLIALSPIVGGETTVDDTVQLPSDGLGVNRGTNCGGPAGVVGPGEQLKVDLGPYFGDDVAVRSAALVIGKTHPNDKKLKVSYGSPTVVVEEFDIPVGGSTVQVQPDTPVTSFTLESTATQSSRGLSLKSATSFRLVTPSDEFEKAVFCSEQVSQAGGSGDIAKSAVFLRGENALKAGTSTTCVDVGVSVDILKDVPGVQGDNRVVFWDNSVIGVDGSRQAVNGTITIEWTPILSAAAARLDRKIDYDGPGPGGFTNTLWCESFASSTTAGKVTFTAVLPNYEGAGHIVVNGVKKAPWCLVSDVRELRGGLIHQTEVLFGSGDPYRG